MERASLGRVGGVGAASGEEVVGCGSKFWEIVDDGILVEGVTKAKERGAVGGGCCGEVRWAREGSL